MISGDLIDVPIDVLGGYCPAIPPSDLPPGAANVAQDVQFPLAAVRSRGGLRNYATSGDVIPGTAAVNGLKTYLTPTIAQRLLVWDSLGNFYKENPQGALNLINSRPYANLNYQSQTLFGREYQAFFNSLGGYDIPRQYDDTNWDRVSQVGPGSAPTVADQALLFAVTGADGGATSAITAISEAGTTVTVVATSGMSAEEAGFNNFVGQQAQIAGVGSGYDGTYTVTSFVIGASLTITFEAGSGLPTLGAGGTIQFTIARISLASGNVLDLGSRVRISGVPVAGYDGVWDFSAASITAHVFYVFTASFGLGSSSGGTASPAGYISAGLHQVSVAFITRQGFITPAAPPSSWTSSGNIRAQVSDIATGPDYVTARLLLFTPVITAPATTGSFYSLPTVAQGSPFPAMLIPDNTTTTLLVDFLDTVLIASFQANYLFTQLELGECADMLGYNARTVWLGERARLPNFVNLSFDGGFKANVPRGWSSATAGGGSALAAGLPADWGDAYVITGDGATSVRGGIGQSAYLDYLGVAIIASATNYSIRARIRKAGNLTQGTLHINLTSASMGISTTGITVTAAQLTTSYQEFIAPLTDVPLSSPPFDLILNVYADGTPNNGGQFLVDSIEPFATNNPFNSSVARFSHAFNPESFDSVTGQVQVRPGDGQQLRSGFPLRNSLYLAKDHYLGYVTDDGTNEPASWTFTEVSATIGICGPNAVDWTEEWAAFAERSGLYVCWGGDPVKITQEIQFDASFAGRVSWESINWAAASTIWVRIDQVKKMILVGAPINGATTPNVVFMLDYRWLDSAEDIANTPLVTYSSYTGKILGHGKGRRWAIWNITANSMAFAERTDGTAKPFYGNGVGNGKIYQQFDCAAQPTDDGAVVASVYQTYGCPSSQEEQQYQLRAHRKLAGYLKFRAVGVGTLGLAIGTAQRSTLLRAYALSSTPAGDGERPLNIQAERFYVNFNTSTAGNWFQLERLILCMKKSSTALVRGVSS